MNHDDTDKGAREREWPDALDAMVAVARTTSQIWAVLLRKALEEDSKLCIPHEPGN